VVWRALQHPNVLPLLGVTVTEDQLVVVSEWMGGNVMEFMKTDVNVDRLGLVRFSFSVLPITHDDVITVARRYHSGVGLYA